MRHVLGIKSCTCLLLDGFSVNFRRCNNFSFHCNFSTSVDKITSRNFVFAFQAAGGAGHMITSEQLAAALASAAGQPTASTVSRCAFNPSSAEATSIQCTRMHRFLKTI